jgi:glycosyltransferase involved in cell wall biosynthesis
LAHNGVASPEAFSLSFLIAVPAYNEARRIGRVLQGLANWRERVIVIDDGSIDGTFDVVESLGFKVVRHDKNRGVGRALKTAVQYAMNTGSESLVTLDADGQHDPSFLEAFLNNLHSSDLVMGARRYSVAPSHKAAANLFAALVFKAVFNVRLADVACGYRAFRCSSWMLRLPSDSYGFLYEQLAHFLASRGRISTVEMPAQYNPDVLWATRAVEVIGLLEAATSSSMAATMKGPLEAVQEAVRHRGDFAFEIDGHSFNFFYISTKDSYVVQADIRQAVHTIVELGQGGVYLEGDI